jgi:hypothetical protein
LRADQFTHQGDDPHILSGSTFHDDDVTALTSDVVDVPKELFPAVLEADLEMLRSLHFPGHFHVGKPVENVQLDVASIDTACPVVLATGR